MGVQLPRRVLTHNKETAVEKMMVYVMLLVGLAVMNCGVMTAMSINNPVCVMLSFLCGAMFFVAAGIFRVVEAIDSHRSKVEIHCLTGDNHDRPRPRD